MDESVISPPQETGPIGGDGKVEVGIESNYREFAPLYRHLEIDKTDRADKALGEIWDYLKQVSPSKDKDSVILEYIKLAHELGSSSFGEPSYAKVYRYVRVYNQFKKSGDLLEELKQKA
jgi:hypothetical protein